MRDAPPLSALAVGPGGSIAAQRSDAPRPADVPAWARLVGWAVAVVTFGIVAGLGLAVWVAVNVALLVGSAWRLADRTARRALRLPVAGAAPQRAAEAASTAPAKQS